MTLLSLRHKQSPVLPQAKNKIAQADRLAQVADRWIDRLAADAGMHRLAYIRFVRGRAFVAREIASTIATNAIAEADRLFDAEAPLPRGDMLSDRIMRARYAERERQARAEWDAALTYDEDADKATKEIFAAIAKEAGA